MPLCSGRCVLLLHHGNGGEQRGHHHHDTQLPPQEKQLLQHGDFCCLPYLLICQQYRKKNISTFVMSEFTVTSIKKITNVVVILGLQIGIKIMPKVVVILV